MAKDASVTDIQQVSQQALVPIANPEEQARYYSLGMTYMSDNQSIIPRDLAGNILFEESALVKPLLIIEPVAEQITTISTLRVLDTAFQYYKFPVSVNVTSSIDIDLDFDIQAIDVEVEDLISTRLTIPARVGLEDQPQTQRALLAGISRLPFVGGEQEEIGTFTITPDILDTLRANNQTLKFTIQTQFYHGGSNGVFMSIERAMPEVWRGSGKLYEVQTYASKQAGYSDGPNAYPLHSLEYVLDIINDAAPYDKYWIQVNVGNAYYALTDNCYWKIDVIDIPTTPSLTGTVGYGVYSFGGSSRLVERTTSGAESIFYKSGAGQLEALGDYPVPSVTSPPTETPEPPPPTDDTNADNNLPTDDTNADNNLPTDDTNADNNFDDGTVYLTTNVYFPFGTAGFENEVRSLITSNIGANAGQILGSWQFSNNEWVAINDTDNTDHGGY